MQRNQEGLDLSQPSPLHALLCSWHGSGPAVWRRLMRTQRLPLRHHITGFWEEPEAKAAGQKLDSIRASSPWAPWRSPGVLRQIQRKQGKD